MITLVKGNRLHERALADRADKILVALSDIIQEMEVDWWVQAASV